MEFTTGEFCAGCGGSSLGFSDFFKNKWMVENDKTCCETLRKNFPDSEIIQEDINSLDFTEEKYQNLHFVFIGSPCQSFSYAGRKKGTQDPRGAILFKFIEFLEIAKPKTFMIENVKGLKSHLNGETLNSLIEDMKALKYFVKYEVLDASYYNVPQKRERLIIFGSLLDDTFDFPEKTENRLNLKGAFDGIIDNKISLKYPDKKLDLFRLIPAGGCWKNLPENLQKEYLGVSYSSGGGKTGILARLSWNKPSLTLLTTPSQKQTERCHPEELRPLTIKESARIQTFPDDYIFYGSNTQIYKQIGNAVPVNLAKSLAEQVYKYLEEKKYLLSGKTSLKRSIKRSIKAFEKLESVYKKKVDLKGIDPFKKAFDIKHLGITEKEWEKVEKNRKKDKAVNNQIGYLHQTILGNKKGWINLDNDKELQKKYKVDLCKSDFSIFVEVKNKYNTMNSSSKSETVRRLLNIRKFHPDARLIIALINSNTNKEDSDGIEYMDGYNVYKLIFKYPCFNELLNYINEL